MANVPRFKGLVDSVLKLLSGATITANTNGAQMDLGSGFAPGGAGWPMVAVIPFTTVKLSAGNETYQFKVQDSPDGVTWTDRSANRSAADDGIATTDGQAGEVALPCAPINRYVRLVVTVGGTAPSITVGDVFLSPLDI